MSKTKSPKPGTFESRRAKILEDVLEGARCHAEASMSEHEVGDLQSIVRVAIMLMTPDQITLLLMNDSVKEVLEWR